MRIKATRLKKKTKKTKKSLQVEQELARARIIRVLSTRRRTRIRGIRIAPTINISDSSFVCLRVGGRVTYPFSSLFRCVQFLVHPPQSSLKQCTRCIMEVCTWYCISGTWHVYIWSVARGRLRTICYNTSATIYYYSSSISININHEYRSFTIATVGVRLPLP